MLNGRPKSPPDEVRSVEVKTYLNQHEAADLDAIVEQMQSEGRSVALRECLAIVRRLSPAERRVLRLRRGSS